LSKPDALLLLFSRHPRWMSPPSFVMPLPRLISSTVVLPVWHAVVACSIIPAVSPKLPKQTLVQRVEVGWLPICKAPIASLRFASVNFISKGASATVVCTSRNECWRGVEFCDTNGGGGGRSNFDEQPVGGGSGMYNVDDMPVGMSSSTQAFKSGSSMPDIPEQVDEGAIQLHACPSCDRRFNERALKIHMKACNKLKRKAFDITEKRYEGLVDESELARIKQAQRVDEKADKQAKLDKQAKKDKWRREHEQLQGAMRANKGTGEAAVHTPDPGLVPCPHCGRKFNESSADRHIAICQSVFSKKNAAKPAAKNAGNRKYR